ncbi:MAG: DNRLRE domain-containing protein [Candidatus Omnitrophica bacterium]|nr:DNRLRE domain-containing protein [Candidatus Omnitrophota bacterium]
MMFKRVTIKFIFLSGMFLCLLTVTARNGYAAQKLLGWSDAQAATWQKMRTENHPLWQRLVNEVHSDRYRPGDYGLRDGMMYLITGDKSYATSAWHKMDNWCGKTYRGTGGDDAWCNTFWKGKIPRDGTREQFLRLAMLYHWTREALSVEDRKNMRDVLELWTDLVLSDRKTHGTRLSDSDETVGHYFGAVIYALAIQDEDPQRSQAILNFAGTNTGSSDTAPLGGLNATGANNNSWRNAIARFAQLAKGGQWMESSSYNRGTVRLLLQGVAAVNNFLGEDKFPEITALYPDFAKAFVLEVAPDLRDFYQWGDNQETHYIRYYSRVATLGVVCGLSKDPECLSLYDELLSRSEETIHEDYLPFADPYSPRKVLSSHGAYHADGRGIAYHRQGWNLEDSFFGSQFTNVTHVDHRLGALSNFALYRHGDWVIDNTRGYYGHWDQDAPYQNTMLVNGGFSNLEEAYGEVAFSADETYLYHAGTTGGQYRDERFGNPPLETVHEWTRSHVYFHNEDGSDSIVIFDRLNADDPTDEDIQPVGKFDRLPKLIKQRINGVEAKHQWILHLTELNPRIEGNEISWMGESNEEVTLTTFMTDYVTQIYDEKLLHNKGYPLYLGGYVRDKDLGYQLRLIPNQKSGWQTFLNLIHVGGKVEKSKLESLSGEKAQGVLLNFEQEQKVVLFSAKKGETIAPTSTDSSGRVVHAPQKLSQLAALRYFKSGFEINIEVFNPAKVWIMDLDPNLKWNVEVDGKVIEDALVNDQGVMQFTLAKGSYLSKVFTDSTCDALQWEGCQIQEDCEKLNYFWYLNKCHSSPEVLACGVDHIEYCKTEEECLSLGNYWYDQSCHSQSAPAVCTSDSLSLCLTENDCQQAQGFWYDEGCHVQTKEDENNIKTITLYPVADTQIKGWIKEANVNGQGLGVKRVSDNYDRVSLLKFDLSSLPEGVVVKDAFLKFTLMANQRWNRQNYIYEGLKDWSETEANWLEYRKGQAWGVPGARGQGTDLNGVYGSVVGAVAMIDQETVAKDVEITYQTNENFKDLIAQKSPGILNLVMHQENRDNSDALYYDRENPDSNKRPKLIIQYEEINIVNKLSCDSQHLNLCLSATDCGKASGYWYDESCQATPQITCDAHHRNLCLNPAACESAQGFWYEDACHDEAPILKEKTITVALSPTADLQLKGWSKDTNFNNQGLGIKSVYHKFDRTTLLKFSLEDIPKEAVINDVQLKFTLASKQRWNRQNYVYEGLVDWNETEATWNEYRKGQSWAEGGARRSGQDINGVYGTMQGAIAFINQGTAASGALISYQSLNGFQQLVKDKAGSMLNLVIHQEKGDNSDVSYYDRETNAINKRPQLFITYTILAP